MTLIVTITIILLILLIFIGILFYKISSPSWYHQFYSQNFTDKDCFTRIIKFILNR